jgi:hypothetical protein
MPTAPHGDREREYWSTYEAHFGAIDRLYVLKEKLPIILLERGFGLSMSSSFSTVTTTISSN